jgi:hypothetical protein
VVSVAWRSDRLARLELAETVVLAELVWLVDEAAAAASLVTAATPEPWAETAVTAVMPVPVVPVVSAPMVLTVAMVATADPGTTGRPAALVVSVGRPVAVELVELAVRPERRAPVALLPRVPRAAPDRPDRPGCRARTETPAMRVPTEPPV